MVKILERKKRKRGSNVVIDYGLAKLVIVQPTSSNTIFVTFPG